MAHGYTDGDIERAFRHNVRSDWISILVRLVALSVVFGLLGRAILRFDPPAGFLLLPLVAEFLMIRWLALLLSRTVITCPAFGEASNRPVAAVVWTMIWALVLSIVLAVDQGDFSWSRVPAAWAECWDLLLESGVIWAFVIQIGDLFYRTAPDVLQWQREGGKFFWNSVVEHGVRVATIWILLFICFCLFVLFGEQHADWIIEERRNTAWSIFGFLTVVEFGALVIGVMVHRDLVIGRQLPADSAFHELVRKDPSALG